MILSGVAGLDSARASVGFSHEVRPPQKRVITRLGSDWRASLLSRWKSGEAAVYRAYSRDRCPLYGCGSSGKGLRGTPGAVGASACRMPEPAVQRERSAPGGGGCAEPYPTDPRSTGWRSGP
jgi:hypothetical protein